MMVEVCIDGLIFDLIEMISLSLLSIQQIITLLDQS